MSSSVQAQDRVERFEALVMPHVDSAYNLARWMTRNASDAEDIAQEALLRAFRFFETFRGDDARVWVLTIVRNTYFTWIRRQMPLQNSAEFDEGIHTDVEEAVTPESALLKQSRSEEVRHAIAELPPEYREVILMRELEQLSYKEIAAITRSPLGTVMSRISRARSLLRNRMRSQAAEVQQHD